MVPVWALWRSFRSDLTRVYRSTVASWDSRMNSVGVGKPRFHRVRKVSIPWCFFDMRSWSLLWQVSAFRCRNLERLNDTTTL